MRCPKCSYISFDLVESCTKCGKNISRAAEDLKGTVADVELPSFLNPDFNKYEAEDTEAAAGAAGGDSVLDLDIEEDEEMADFSLEEEGPGSAEEVDFAIEEEAAVEAEPAGEIGVEEQEEMHVEEALDISDLAPEDEPAGDMGEEELGFEAETGAGEETTFEEEPVSAEEREAGELEDLEVEGIDLESSSAPKTGKVMPSVKTGTALDDFDIDLGDLISPKKESGKK